MEPPRPSKQRLPPAIIRLRHGHTRLPVDHAPLLRFSSDGKEHLMSEAREALAAEMTLSDQDLSARLPSGGQTVWSNRVAWAKVHLDRAGLLKTTRRGVFEITDRGRQVLAQPPERITLKFLSQYPEFLAFRARKIQPISGADHAETPDTAETLKRLDRAYLDIRASLAAELDKVKSGSPQFFERLVVELLLKDGLRRFTRGGGARRSAKAATKASTASSTKTVSD